MRLRSSHSMTAVLAEFLSARDDWHYGYNISRSTGLKSGTLYPLLIRLAEHGLLETAWSTSEEGKPPRHMYRLTGHGLRYAIEQSAADARPALKIALGEASTV